MKSHHPNVKDGVKENDIDLIETVGHLEGNFCWQTVQMCAINIYCDLTNISFLRDRSRSRERSRRRSKSRSRERSERKTRDKKKSHKKDKDDSD